MFLTGAPQATIHVHNPALTAKLLARFVQARGYYDTLDMLGDKANLTFRGDTFVIRVGHHRIRPTVAQMLEAIDTNYHRRLELRRFEAKCLGE